MRRQFLAKPTDRLMLAIVAWLKEPLGLLAS